MKFKVYDNGWNEGETLVEVNNDTIQKGDYYLFIGKPFSPKKHLGWCIDMNKPNIKLSGSIELCDSVELAQSLIPRSMYKKIIKTNRKL